MVSRCFFQVITVLLLVIPSVLSTGEWFLDPERFEVIDSGYMNQYSGKDGESTRIYTYKTSTLVNFNIRGRSSTSHQDQLAQPQLGTAKVVKIFLQFNSQYGHVDWTHANVGDMQMIFTLIDLLSVGCVDTRI